MFFAKMSRPREVGRKWRGVGPMLQQKKICLINFQKIFEPARAEEASGRENSFPVKKFNTFFPHKNGLDSTWIWGSGLSKSVREIVQK